MSKKFEPYPQRQIRLDDEPWEELRKNKDKNGGTWNDFIKAINQLIKQNEKSKSLPRGQVPKDSEV